MNRPIAEDVFSGKPSEEAPLDPAVERVRAKLVRFAILNIGILFAALAVVVAALAWRTASGSRADTATLTEAEIALPAGAEILSHALSTADLSLLAALPDGSRAVLVFDRQTGRLVGRYPIAQK